MKRSRFFVLSMLIGSLFTAGALNLAHGAEVAKTVASAKTTAADQRVVLKVESISCGSCEARIREALKAEPGIAAVEVNLVERTVTVDYAKGLTDDKKIAERISKVGYPAKLLTLSAPTQPLKTPSASKGGCGGNCCGAQPG